MTDYEIKQIQEYLNKNFFLINLKQKNENQLMIHVRFLDDEFIGLVYIEEDEGNILSISYDNFKEDLLNS